MRGVADGAVDEPAVVRPRGGESEPLLLQTPVKRRAPKTTKPKTRKRRKRKTSRLSWVTLAIETVSLLAAALLAVVALLGAAASRFAGGDLFRSVLPFAATVLGLLLSGLILASLWLWLRRRLAIWWHGIPATLAFAIAVAAVWGSAQPQFHQEVAQLQRFVGGPGEAERQVIAHQVYAAYRRADRKDLQKIIDRARVFETSVTEAGVAFGVDPEVLIGVGAAESSFYPRDSKDGGRGLFQITAPPEAAVAAVKQELGITQLDALNQRHNAFLAAATLRHYLTLMKDDLFLGLLAYNIGPRNGGMVSIMKQYGARDFMSMQPYLQNLPRDYPIRVLSAALAYRLARREGSLPAYEDGANAARIQSIGIPGIASPSSTSGSPM